jgi:hypothetical protein
VRAVSRLVVVRRLVLLAPIGLSGCAPGPLYCSPMPDRFDSNRSPARENDREVHPATGLARVAIAAAGMLAGYRCN